MRVAMRAKISKSAVSCLRCFEWRAVSEGERDTYNTKLCRYVLVTQDDPLFCQNACKIRIQSLLHVKMQPVPTDSSEAKSFIS